MITKKEYDKYTTAKKKYESHFLVYPCWICRKDILSESNFFCLQKQLAGKKQSAWIYFHALCFVEIAGSDYDFDNSGWSDKT